MLGRPLLVVVCQRYHDAGGNHFCHRPLTQRNTFAAGRVACAHASVIGLGNTPQLG
jgi:hypothetical protein